MTLTPDEQTALDALRTTINAAVDRTDATRLVLSRLQDNLTEFEALLKKPPEPPAPVYAGPGKFSYIDGKLSGVAAPYLVHFGEWQLPATIADKKRIIDLIKSMNVWNGVTVFVHWKETNAIPAYLKAAGLDWWADTLNLAYLKLPYSDYVAYVVKMMNVYGAVGGVIDDAHNFSDAQMTAMCRPLLDMNKPVIASYGGTFDVKTKHPSVYSKIQIAWQLYVTRTGTQVDARTQVAKMLATRGRCDVANDDVFSNNGTVPTPDEVRAMFAACQAAGVRNHMSYAAWDSDGWNWTKAPELVAALVESMQAFWLAQK